MPPKAKKVRLPKIKRIEEKTIDCLHKFNDAEKLELGRSMTSKYTTITELEESLKSVQADYKARIKQVQAEYNVIHGKLQSGEEWRPTKCVVHYNVPQKGMKRIIRLDTKAVVREESLSPADLEQELFEQRKLEEDSKRAKEKAAQQNQPAAVNGALNPVDPTKAASTAATA